MLEIDNECQLVKGWRRQCKMSHAEKLKRDPFAVSYNKNLTPAVSAACIGDQVSVRRCCGCIDGLFLAWGRDWFWGLPGKAISQSRLDRTFPGLLHSAQTTGCLTAYATSCLYQCVEDNSVCLVENFTVLSHKDKSQVYCKCSWLYFISSMINNRDWLPLNSNATRFSDQFQK